MARGRAGYAAESQNLENISMWIMNMLERKCLVAGDKCEGFSAISATSLWLGDGDVSMLDYLIGPQAIYAQRRIGGMRETN